MIHSSLGLTKLRVLALAMVIGAVALLTSTILFAHSGDVLISTFGTPTIDGVQSPGEWDTAVQIPVFPFAPGTLFIMHDATNLYFALRVTDSTFGSRDGFEIRLDNNHNGIIDDGDDGLFFGDSFGPPSFRDTHHEDSFGILDAQQDGTGAAANDGTHNFFEISHPLNSGNIDDIAVFEGDTISFARDIFWTVRQGPGRNLRWGVLLVLTGD